MSRACLTVLLCVGVDVTTAFLPATPAPSTTDAPPTLVPGLDTMCEERTDLNETAGNVTYAHSKNTTVHCWHIECSNSVVITFSHFELPYPNFQIASLDLYSSSNGVDYTQERFFTHNEGPGSDPIVLNGLTYVQLFPFPSANVSFSYVCVDATRVPTTDAPPTTDPPPTPVPGIEYTCDLVIDLNETAGKVTYPTPLPFVSIYC